MSTSAGSTLLGIDLGTSSVKVVLVDSAFTVLAQATAEYPVDRPQPGWSESDPQQWWSAVVAATRQVLGAGPAPAAIGLSGQMHGLVVCDAAAAPLRPALLWSDTRAGQVVERYRDLPDAVRHRLGNPLSPGMAGPLLGWLARHEPQLLARARWALQPKDWVRSQLTGRIDAEPSDASATLLYDVIGRRWDAEVLAALELRADLLPDLLPSAGSPAGTLQPAAAVELGLTAGVPVAAGAADTAAAALGSGLVRPGVVQLTIGSGTQIITPTAAPTVGSVLPHPVTHTYRAATADGWYAMAATLNGGLTLDWVRRTLGVDWADLYTAAGTDHHDDDPLFLPYLNGERTPLLDPSLTASWIGLTGRHDRTTLLRTALEGVAHGIADAFDALPGTGDAAEHGLRLAGGGSVAPAWRQLLSDVIGVPVQALEIPGASALGAAATAALAAGLTDEPTLVTALTPRTTPVATPRPGHTARHRERREQARHYREALQGARLRG